MIWKNLCPSLQLELCVSAQNSQLRFESLCFGTSTLSVEGHGNTLSLLRCEAVLLEINSSGCNHVDLRGQAPVQLRASLYGGYLQAQLSESSCVRAVHASCAFLIEAAEELRCFSFIKDAESRIEVELPGERRSVAGLEEHWLVREQLESIQMQRFNCF
jgi:hypothetical protein